MYGILFAPVMYGILFAPVSIAVDLKEQNNMTCRLRSGTKLPVKANKKTVKYFLFVFAILRQDFLCQLTLNFD